MGWQLRKATGISADGSVIVGQGINPAGKLSSWLAELTGMLGDFNNDDQVDGRDFLALQRDPSLGNLADWRAHYGAALHHATAVPEPPSLCFTLVAAIVAFLPIRSISPTDSF